MIVPDVNLLVYAYNQDAREHPAARRWWDAVLAGSEEVGLAHPVVAGFLRLSTRSGAVARPLLIGAACEIVRGWLRQQHCRLLNDGPRHLETVMALVEAVGVGGNLVSDANIAAVALEHGGVVYSADVDFGRFRGVRWRNPLR